jgi:hypothetical protein
MRGGFGRSRCSGLDRRSGLTHRDGSRRGTHGRAAHLASSIRLPAAHALALRPVRAWPLPPDAGTSGVRRHKRARGSEQVRTPPASLARNRRQAGDRDQPAHRPGGRQQHGRAGNPLQPPWPDLGRRRLGALVVTHVREELPLTVYAIDLAGGSSQQRHRAAARLRTRAVGSRSGELSGSRPLARGWGSPCCRPFNRPPASQGTDL